MPPSLVGMLPETCPQTCTHTGILVPTLASCCRLPDVHTDLNSAAEECRMAVCTAIEGLLKKVRTCTVTQLVGATFMTGVV